jgi:hypothetical protein
VFQYFDGSFNAYLDKCLEIIAFFNDFTLQHVSRIEDTVANNLVQQASSFRSNREKFGFLENPDVSICQTGQSSFWLMCSAIICSTEPSSAKPDGPVSETEGLGIFVTSNESSETMMTDPDDWRTPLVCYLENPGHIADRKAWHQALKYVMLENILYRRTIKGVLLKCLGLDQSTKDMGKVHEDICGTH